MPIIFTRFKVRYIYRNLLKKAYNEEKATNQSSIPSKDRRLYLNLRKKQLVH